MKKAIKLPPRKLIGDFYVLGKVTKDLSNIQSDVFKFSKKIAALCLPLFVLAQDTLPS